VGAQDYRPAAQIGVGVTCAVDGDAGDPLLLGQRVVAILETGLRTATYKLAILMALIGRGRGAGEHEFLREHAPTA
jgi:hypothetical protein